MIRSENPILSKLFLFSSIFIGCTLAHASEEKMITLFSFTPETDDAVWTSNNDGVMGGISTGSARMVADGMEFSGELSLENSGGFASVYQPVSLDLSDFEGIRIRVLGDGRTYQLRLESDALYRDRWPVTFGAEFPTTAGEWTEAFIPFAELRQSWRGRSLEGYTFNPADLRRMAIMLADKKPGPFSLKVDRIEAN
ncbi:MAG: CIA30 family protein [Verrucomicrobiota bacterium]